jgi:hypothetical protein
MIRLTIAATGRETFVRPDAIYTVEEAPANSRWHHIYSVVKLTDGSILECRQDAQWVADRWAGKVENTTAETRQTAQKDTP